jgi:hypothetical protein
MQQHCQFSTPDGVEFSVDVRGVISSSLLRAWVSHINVTPGALRNKV